MNTPRDIFEQHIKPKINSEVAKRINAVYVFDVKGPNGGVWRVDLKDSPGVTEGNTAGADVFIEIDDDDFVAMVNGQLNPQMAYMSGKMKVEGNTALALKIQLVLNIY